jgi:hypothetical protein
MKTVQQPHFRLPRLIAQLEDIYSSCNQSNEAMAAYLVQNRMANDEAEARRMVQNFHRERRPAAAQN